MDTSIGLELGNMSKSLLEFFEKES